MCFDTDSHPPIPPIAGGALDAGQVELASADGTRFMGYQARAARPTGAGIVILPDVRGLHGYYRELAQRFAEHGVDALAIDYFGRTAPSDDRGEGFDWRPHVDQLAYDSMRADAEAGIAHLRTSTGVERTYTTGFCMGGRLTFLTATWGMGLAGVIGFYGWPTGPSRNGTPAPADVATSIAAPVLGIFGGADQGIGSAAVAEFEAALTDAGVPHRILTYEGAPHSFFDRKAKEFGDASAAAWSEVLRFTDAAEVPAP